MLGRLKQYRGFLTADRIATGMNLAERNARRLADDAQLLFNAERYPSAASLAILSLEEHGKVSILRGMAIAASEKGIAALWKRYRQHTEKHVMTLVPDRINRGARLLVDFKDCFLSTSLEERQTYDSLKQLGFYSDCLGKANWSMPDEIIQRELASGIVERAVALTKDIRETTPREIELWVTHMQGGVTRSKLEEYAKAAVREGLEPEGYAESMMDFTAGIDLS